MILYWSLGSILIFGLIIGIVQLGKQHFGGDGMDGLMDDLYQNRDDLPGGDDLPSGQISANEQRSSK